jgi:glutaredoxin
MDKRFIIYGRANCPFCVYAIDFCKANDAEYIFLDYSSNPSILDECKEFYKHNTVPIILSNDTKTGATKKIGGYTDLLECLP